MALQYTPLVLGVMLVVAVGSFAYSLWNTNSNRQQNYSYGNSQTSFDYDCGYDTKPDDSRNNNGERKRKRKFRGLCPICLDTLKTNVKQLTCKHEFHEKCITMWFRDNNTCPICRTSSDSNL